MAGMKTVPTQVHPDEFISAIGDTRRRNEARTIDAMLRQITGLEPRMWGPSIVGYGSYHYRYESGREGDMCRIGFAPRKAQHVIYLMGEFGDRRGEADALFARLGKHSVGKACLNIRRLGDVDLEVLEKLARLNWEVMAKRYPA